MPNRKNTYRLLLLGMIAVMAYFAITLPPKVIEQYNAAAKQSSLVGYAYLAIVFCRGDRAGLAGVVGHVEGLAEHPRQGTPPPPAWKESQRTVGSRSAG